ncbi:MAG: hypothetical protein KC646_03405 [Candidatus Cloacimonetes bacterium]|nr:hypothetical protein [Candidatus Cloacimonadota bacterium]
MIDSIKNSIDGFFSKETIEEDTDLLEKHLINPIRNLNEEDSKKRLISKSDLSEDIIEALDTLILKFGDECILPAARDIELMSKNSNSGFYDQGGSGKFIPQYGEWGYCYGKNLQASILWEIRIQLRDRNKESIQYFFVNAPKFCFVYLSQIDVLNPNLFSPIYLLLREYLISLEAVTSSTTPEIFNQNVESFSKELVNAGAFERLHFKKLTFSEFNLSIITFDTSKGQEIGLYLQVKFIKSHQQYYLDAAYRSKSRNIDLRLSAPITILEYDNSFQAFVSLIRLKSIEFASLD